jgi:hypothetical protein
MEQAAAAVVVVVERGVADGGVRFGLPLAQKRRKTLRSGQSIKSGAFV